MTCAKEKSCEDYESSKKGKTAGEVWTNMDKDGHPHGCLMNRAARDTNTLVLGCPGGSLSCETCAKIAAVCYDAGIASTQPKPVEESEFRKAKLAYYENYEAPIDDCLQIFWNTALELAIKINNEEVLSGDAANRRIRALLEE